MPSRYVRRMVYDGVQRLLHWWIAVASFFLAASGLWGAESEASSGHAEFWHFHILIGKFLVTGVVARIVWGLIGPEHARFSTLVHIKLWLKMLRKPHLLTSDGPFGHHPQASASYVLFYVMIIFSCVTGLALAGILHGQGPIASRLFDELAYVEITRAVHQVMMWSIFIFATLHVAAIIFHEKHDRIPIAQSIVSGFQYRTAKEKDLEQTNESLPRNNDYIYESDSARES